LPAFSKVGRGRPAGKSRGGDATPLGSRREWFEMKREMRSLKLPFRPGAPPLPRRGIVARTGRGTSGDSWRQLLPDADLPGVRPASVVGGPALQSEIDRAAPPQPLAPHPAQP